MLGELGVLLVLGLISVCVGGLWLGLEFFRAVVVAILLPITSVSVVIAASQ